MNWKELAARDDECEKDKPFLDAQQQHWNEAYSEEADLFGEDPSYPAQEALDVFKKEEEQRILERARAPAGFEVHVDVM